MNSNPLVSISCITYNHAPFIRTCLDSFLLQQTNFAFEVIIHDDASTDATKEIIEEYTAKYPDVFFPLFQTENQYSQGVRGMMVRFNFPRCRGKYIALCEGDDYWTDPLKLQKQVDFLEKNEDCSIVGTNALFISKNSSINKQKIRKDDISKRYKLEDFLLYNNLLTCTVLFRNINFETFPALKVPFGDWFLYAYILSKSGGYAFEFNDSTAGYRIHQGGVFSSMSSENIEWSKIVQIIAIYKFLSLEFNKNSFKTLNFHFCNLISTDVSFKRKMIFGVKYFNLVKMRFPFKRFFKSIRYV